MRRCSAGLRRGSRFLHARAPARLVAPDRGGCTSFITPAAAPSARAAGAARSQPAPAQPAISGLRPLHQNSWPRSAASAAPPARRASLSSFEGRFVLLVTLALEGGVERFVAERCRQIRAQGLFPLVLSRWRQKTRAVVNCGPMRSMLPNLQYDIPEDLPELTALFAACASRRSRFSIFCTLMHASSTRCARCPFPTTSSFTTMRGSVHA